MLSFSDARGAGSLFVGSKCEATSCGILPSAAQKCGGGPMTDTSIRMAVRAWLSNPTAAEATYGHISTWDTSGVTDMSWLFSAFRYSAAWSFNEPIGGWDVRKVTSMSHMFADAKSFNQDISGWQVSVISNCISGLSFSS